MTEQPTPELIRQVATSYMAAKHLFAAANVGLFEALGEGPLTLDQLAAHTGIPSNTARISADAMAALGLLDRDGDRYVNSLAADAFLSGKGPADLRPILRLFDMRYSAWDDFETAIRSGSGPGIFEHLDPQQQRIFSEGVESTTAGSARALAEGYRFKQHQRLLDLGGGTGSFLLPIMARHPTMPCGLLELPGVAAIARRRLQESPGEGRVEIYEGDLLADPIPPGYDLFLLANVVHVFSAEQNQQIFERIHNSSQPASRLLLVDFWTNPTHTEPLFAALMAGEFLLAGGHGDVYSEDEARKMLHATGWKMLDRQPLGGPASLIVAEWTETGRDA
jgi:hypothetical protein